MYKIRTELLITVLKKILHILRVIILKMALFNLINNLQQGDENFLNYNFQDYIDLLPEAAWLSPNHLTSKNSFQLLRPLRTFP